MTHDEAVMELRRLLADEPGVLQIITNVPTLDGYHPTDPRSCVCLPVTRIETDARGGVTAFADDGSWCYGYPADVLAALLERHQAEERERIA